jgi:hypothetical protein
MVRRGGYFGIKELPIFGRIDTCSSHSLQTVLDAFRLCIEESTGPSHMLPNTSEYHDKTPHKRRAIPMQQDIEIPPNREKKARKIGNVR